MPKDHGIGASSLRREDVRFLTGDGRYTDDIDVPGQLYVHFLRSDVAHATIDGIDIGWRRECCLVGRRGRHVFPLLA